MSKQDVQWVRAQLEAMAATAPEIEQRQQLARLAAAQVTEHRG